MVQFSKSCLPLMLGALLAASAGVATAAGGGVNVTRQNVRPIAEYTPYYAVSRASEKLDAANSAAIRGMYWSKAARDDALLAYDFIPAYRQERDTFKRADLLKASVPQLDSAYKASQGAVLYAVHRLDVEGVSVTRYDPAKRGFEVSLNLVEGEGYGWHKPNESKSSPPPEWVVKLVGAWTNHRAHETKTFYHPKNESEAREIESRLAAIGDTNSTMAYLPCIYLGHIVKSQPVTDGSATATTYLVVDAVVVLSTKDGKPLFTIDRKDLGDVVNIQNSRLANELEVTPPKKNSARFM